MNTIKTLSLTSLILLFTTFSLQAQHMHHHSDENVPKDFKSEFTGFVHAYLSLKDALVNSDADHAIHASHELTEQLEEIGQHRLEGDAHMVWMETYESLAEQMDSMHGAEHIDEIREQFQVLSGLLVEAVKVFGIVDVVYHQYCPMEEADWLSSEEQIQNPYSPDMMLSCGEVIDRIE